jgi:hypothetical protein
VILTPALVVAIRYPIMAATNLIENFQNLNIRDKTSETPPYATCLPFNPKSDFGISPSSLGQVDRYLFRLFDRYSDGYTDNKWVKSRDAVNTNFHFDKDVFATKDRSRAAGALRRHLQWDGRPEEEDNFVSWSSSLLLVLQYAFYRRAYYAYQGHKLEDIFLCIVDTTMLPDGVFLSDMPLIKAFSRYTDREAYKSLEHLKNLRQGSYYFGEYLSQGALQVEGCCAIVSMGDIVGDGLYELRGEFEAAALTSNKSWANAVLRLRETFSCSGSVSPPLTTHGEIEAALRIGNKFGPSLALPIGLAFLALKPRPAQDARIISASRSLSDRGKPLPLVGVIIILLTFMYSPRTAIPRHNIYPSLEQITRSKAVRCVEESSVRRLPLVHEPA